MSDVELVVVLCAAALLIVALSFGLLRRKRRNRVDYWLPDGSRLSAKRIGPEVGHKAEGLHVLIGAVAGPPL